jgi:hypothetical protein
VQSVVSPTTVIEAPTPGGYVQCSNIPSGHIVVKRVTRPRRSRPFRTRFGVAEAGS